MRRADIPPGTLDLLILRTLEKGGELHGFEVARSIEQFSNDVLGAVLRVREV
jgi:DNA-binding PadR family transcriptional regulator